MKRLLFLFPILAFAQTDLPGPVAALPASAVSTGVCGWNKTQTFKGCLTVQDTITALTGAAVFGPTNTYWQFDRSLQAGGVFPTTNLTGTIGGCQTSGTCPGGLAAPLEWLGLHVQNIYNYGPNPFTIYSDSTLIAIDAFSTQPIQFYTNNTLRGQFLSGGQFELANMAGSGNRCARVNSSGDFSPTGGDCIDPTVPNTFTATQTFAFSPVSLIVSSEIQPATGLGGAPIVHLGDTGAQFLDLFVDTIYNYNTTGSLALIANTLPIIVDTLSNQPIQFYTQNTLRASVLGSGTLEVNNLGGSGTRCVHVNNSGDLSVASADCPANLLPLNNTWTGINTFANTTIVGAEIQPATSSGTPVVNLGDTGSQFLALFVDTIYDYFTSGSLGLVANTVPIIADTLSNQPIQFYTQNTLRAQVTGAGTWQVANLGGSGTVNTCVDNTGVFKITGCPVAGDVISLTSYKKLVEGVGFFFGGTSTVSTGLSIIDSAVCTISRSGGAATTEGCQVQGTSGGSVTFLSTTGAGSSVFTYFVMGN